MRLKPKKKSQILSISDREPEVVRISGSNVFLRIFFEVDILAALESQAFLYNFRLMTTQKTEEKKKSLTALESSFALNAAADRKTQITNSPRSVIYENVIDITKFIPNDKISKIMAGEGARRRKLIKMSTSKDKNATKVPGSRSSVDADVGANESDVTPFRIDSIYRKGKDPARIINEAKFHQPTQKTLGGIRTTGEISKFDKKTQQYRRMMTSQTRTTKSVRFENESSLTVEIPVNFKVSKSKLATYVAEIDATSKTSSVAPPKILQTLGFQVDLNEAFQEYIVPVVPPIVQVTATSSGRSFRIVQRDVNGKSVKIYRRLISNSTANDTGFSLIASLAAKKDQEVFYVDRNVTLGKCIYRVVVFNESDMTSGIFTSHVVPGMRLIERKRQPDTTAILAYESGSNIEVKIFNVPNDVIAARVVRKNISTHESNFTTPATIVGSALKKIERKTLNASFTDSPRRHDTVYSYKVILTDAYGNERLSDNESRVKFVGDSTIQKGRALISSAPTIGTGREPTVTFQVNAPTDEASLDKIYDILVTVGISDLYAEEIKQNKELLSQLVALEMMRFDTTTGLDESFGVVDAGVFQDGSDTRRKSSISNLIPGRTYIYHYRLLVRSSSTIFNGVNAERVDLETSKSYSTNLKKFNSPKTLKKGTLSATSDQVRAVTNTGVKFGASDSSDAEMLAGSTSLTGQVTVRIPPSDTYIESLLAEETPRGNVLRLRLVEGTKQIDHIIIMAEYNGQRAPLRAVHFCGNSKTMYLDDETRASMDGVSYYALPVFADFTQGNMFGPAEIT